MLVSKKGQVVIPVEFRRRLDIQPGMEVNFRIRGNFLVLEVATDIESDIKYLKDKKGLLGENDFDEPQMQEIVRDLLTQQFYGGKNVLTDRIDRKKITIRGSDAIVNQSINLLTRSALPWFDGDFVKTLKNFASVLDLDFPALLSKFTYKLRSMELGGSEMIRMMGGEVIFSMAVGEALSQFRTTVGDMVTELLIKDALARGYVSEFGREFVEDQITKHLAEEYSILMNLRVLREFARANLQSVAQHDFEIIFKDLLDRFEYNEPKQENKIKEEFSEKSPELPDFEL